MHNDVLHGLIVVPGTILVLFCLCRKEVMSHEMGDATRGSVLLWSVCRALARLLAAAGGGGAAVLDHGDSTFSRSLALPLA